MNLNWFGFELNSFLWVFIILNVVNVVIQTVKSIVTINSGKWVASIVNAVAYGLYTIVVVFMSCEGLGLLWKALIIGVANLVGVYVVKLVEEKTRKDKLWEVRATINRADFEYVKQFIDLKIVPANYIDIDKYFIVNFYCATQKESAMVKELLDKYHAKYFVSESKTL